jgi:CRISPR-associated protein Cas2
MARSTYLVAYDVSCPRRLGRTLRAVKAWRTAGQKSVAECLMHPSERNALARELLSIIDADTDRLHMLRLDPRLEPECFGVARPAGSQSFLVV